MEYLLMVVALFLAVGKNVVSKGGGDNFKSFSKLLNLNIMNGVFAIAIYAAFGISFDLMGEPMYLLLALLYAVFAVGGIMLNITAMRYGPVALCSLIYCAGFIITTVYCAIFFDEEISLLSGIGMVLMIISIIAVVYRKSDKEKKTSYKFLFFSIPAMICSGALGIVQKFFMFKYGDGEVNSYLFLSFALIFVISLIIRVLYQPKEFVHFKTKSFLVPAILFSLICVAVNKINMYLTGAIDGVILFPFLNGGSIALTAIASFLLFKERLNLRQWIGTVFCIIAIIMVAIG